MLTSDSWRAKSSFAQGWVTLPADEGVEVPSSSISMSLGFGDSLMQPESEASEPLTVVMAVDGLPVQLPLG